jgi:hypothetical protein
MEVSGQLHAPAPGTHCIRGWVGLRAGLDAVEKRKPCSAGNQTRAVQLVAIPTELSQLPQRVNMNLKLFLTCYLH